MHFLLEKRGRWLRTSLQGEARGSLEVRPTRSLGIGVTHLREDREPWHQRGEGSWSFETPDSQGHYWQLEMKSFEFCGAFKIFLMWTIFKVFTEPLTTSLLCHGWASWLRSIWDLDPTCTPHTGSQLCDQGSNLHPTYGISAPWAGIQHVPPHLEGEVLTTGPPAGSGKLWVLK